MRTEIINRSADLNTSGTKETIAPDAHENKKPVFTAVNLWNIYNKRKVRTAARGFIA